MTTMGKVKLDDLAASIVRCFPTLDLFEQRLSVELYRLLAAGQPVLRETLAERLGIPAAQHLPESGRHDRFQMHQKRFGLARPAAQAAFQASLADCHSCPNYIRARRLR